MTTATANYKSQHNCTSVVQAQSEQEAASLIANEYAIIRSNVNFEYVSLNYQGNSSYYCQVKGQDNVTVDDFTLTIEKTELATELEPELVEYTDLEKPILGHTLSASMLDAAKVLARRLADLRYYKNATVTLTGNEGMGWLFDIVVSGAVVDRVTIYTHA